MHSARARVAASPRRFGRGRTFAMPVPPAASAGVAGELQLFAATFAAGFVFVSILIG